VRPVPLVNIAAFTGGFVVATFIAAQNLGGIVWR